MTYGIALIIAGVFLIASSFIFGFINIGKQARTIFNGDNDKIVSGFGGTFTRHLFAIAGLVVGGLIAFIGIVILYFGY